MRSFTVGCEAKTIEAAMTIAIIWLPGSPKRNLTQVRSGFICVKPLLTPRIILRLLTLWPALRSPQRLPPHQSHRS